MNFKKTSFQILFAAFLLTQFTPFPLFCQWNEEVAGSGTGPSVAVDPDGNIHLCYTTKMMGGDVVYVVRANGQWTKDTLTGSERVYQSALTVDSSGTVHILYAEADFINNTFSLKYIHKEAGDWSSPEAIHSSANGFWSLSIKVSRDDIIHIAYLEAFGMASPGGIYYITNGSGNWVSYGLNDKYQNPAYDDIAMAIDNDGYVHVVSYFPALNGPGYISNAPAGNWSGTQLIQTNWRGGQLEGMIIDVAVDGNNKPHVSYVGSNDEDYVQDNRYATKPFNVWTTEHVDDGSYVSAGNAIACDAEGVVHIAYLHWETGDLRYTMNYSGSWPHEKIASPGAGYGRRVDMETDRHGFAHICYEDGQDILYNTNRVELPAPHIVLSPGQLDFGTVDTSQAPTKLLYVKNEGVLDLHITGMSISGGDSAEFSLEHLCNTIVPGDSCEVRVTFSPDIRGDKQTSLVVKSDDPDTPVITATITGRTPYPVIFTDPEKLEFQPVEVSETDTLPLLIGNIGDEALLLDSLSLAGGASEEFEILSSCTFVPPSGECTIRVVFAPATPGTRESTLRIYSNDPVNPEYDVPLRGQTPAAYIKLESTVIDFGIVQVGMLAREEFPLGNVGQLPLVISSTNITGTDASLFRVTQSCGSVSAGGSCTLGLTFFPRTEGPKSALLTISSNDPDEPSAVVLLKGTGGESESMSYTYGSGEAIQFFCMDTLSAGGYIVGGEAHRKAFLAKISPNGTIVWQKVYSSVNPGGTIHTVREFPGGGFIVAGQELERYRWIARLDKEGGIIWQKRKEEDYWGRIHDVKITSDSAIIAVGESWPDGPSQPDMWICKFDTTGAVLWQKYVGVQVTEAERGMVVLETSGGDFVVAGGHSNFLIPQHALLKHPDGGYLYGGGWTRLWKFSKDGAILWQKEVVQSSASDFWLTHFSPSDNILWQKLYPLSGISMDWIFDLALTPAGDIIAMGVVREASASDLRVMRLTKTGAIVWQRRFKAPGDQEGFVVCVNPSGAIAIAGIVGAPDQVDRGWLVQVSPDGDLEGCAAGFFTGTTAPAIADIKTLLNISLPTRADNVAFVDGTFTASEGNAVAQEYCTGIPLDADHDGVSNTEESGPGGQDEGYDGNGDGIPDMEQGNATSLHNNDNTAYVTLSAGQGLQLMDVAAVDNPSPDDQPEGFDFPLGFFEFTVTGLAVGGAAEVSLFVPDGFVPDTYYKHAPTAGNQVPHWYEFLYDGSTGAEFGTGRIDLHFVDGDRGDEDLEENARVQDVGGPGVTSSSGISDTQPPAGKGLVTIRPNPVRGSAMISFELKKPARVKIEVYNAWGQKVRTLVNERMTAAGHGLEFLPGSLPPGVYFFDIRAGSYREYRKVVVMR